MKLNNLPRNFYIFFYVIISILIGTLLWDKITLPFNNTTGAKGYFAIVQYNPSNDTLRYIFFVSLPLIVFLFFNYTLSKKTINIKELCLEKYTRTTKTHSSIIIIFLIFIIFIFLEFFSVNFTFSRYILDHPHDGTYLSPFQNYIITKKFWISSHLSHGLSDLVYPVLMWKIFGIESIGATRTFTIFLVLFLKILCVVLSYQFTKISNLNDKNKILFFTLFTAIILSMSNYTFLKTNYYISYKDIYIILFLIFFIELFVDSKFRSLSIMLVTAICTMTILFQIDKGAYINFILFFYLIYLIISKKYKDSLLTFFSLIACWFIVINFFGIGEFYAFLENTKSMIISMDMMHGLKYPDPFFSMINDSNGARATRGLIMQITAGLFVLNYIISSESKILRSKKVLFIFLFLLSLLMYKNALGRSDATHIRDSHDMPLLINVFFILNYFLIFLEKKIISNYFLSYKPYISLSIFFLLFYYIYNYNHYNIENIKNYKKNFWHFVKLDDEVFLDVPTKQLIEYYNKIAKQYACVESISFNNAMSYLLKKPSCTKYWASWLASSTSDQKNYIELIKKADPKYILYSSANTEFDGLTAYERIELVNAYVLSNYKKINQIGTHVILEKK